MEMNTGILPHQAIVEMVQNGEIKPSEILQRSEERRVGKEC